MIVTTSIFDDHGFARAAWKCLHMSHRHIQRRKAGFPTTTMRHYKQDVGGSIQLGAFVLLTKREGLTRQSRDDCDDYDADVYPGVSELWNNEGENCDGKDCGVCRRIPVCTATGGLR